MDYQDFIKNKSRIHVPTGIECDFWLHQDLKPHQKDIVSWALRRGRSAIFAGTGLGKTLMEMNWAQCVVEYTSKPVLLLAPLAVSSQISLMEGPKFGFDIIHASSKDDINGAGIYTTNYEKLDKLDLSVFGGVVLDESSILKNQTGKYRTELINRCNQIPFRLAATATPAPNDFMELGNHAEFLGIMSYTDMLSTFFVHDGGSTQNWRLRGHAEDAFWKWMCTWSVMLRKPSDLGYSNEGYDLPKLNQIQHTVGAKYDPNIDTGMLFPLQAETMQERIVARRHTVGDRVEYAASITPEDGHFVWWCNLNSESDELAKSIPDSVEIRGSDTEKSKEEKLIAFSRGDIQRIITKSKVCGFGMNWQHCNQTGFVGMNDSFEQLYQATRRFWRFGQKKEVYAHFIASELEGAVVANIKRKEAQAEKMAEKMVSHMADLSSKEIRGATRDTDQYAPQMEIQLPKFMEI
jgi:superfamily II DNA or RNA helicase